MNTFGGATGVVVLKAHTVTVLLVCQMSLCVEHMACCLLLVPCALLSIVCPPLTDQISLMRTPRRMQPGNLGPWRRLLNIFQRDQSMEDYARDFVGVAHRSATEKTCLMVFFWGGLPWKPHSFQQQRTTVQATITHT